jgi:hypothetical protein
MSINDAVKQHYSFKAEYALSNSASNIIPKKAYAAPKLISLFNETQIAGSNQTNVAEGTGGGFLAVAS